MLTTAAILEATGGRAVSEGTAGFSGISIDSRTIREEELFLALKGERFDGHDFLGEALKRGAGAVVKRNALYATGAAGPAGRLHITDYGSGRTVIEVEDTLKALQDLARYIRKGFGGRVLGVVGSNGKTTTKELLSAVLGTRLKTLKTMGNLNNHIGMPLSLTRVEPGTEAMVLEMGTNRPGDVRELCEIARPDLGVVTNIGYEHLGGFGSLEKVRESELEILPYVKTLALNADDRFLLGGVSLAFRGEIISFGIEEKDSDVVAEELVFSETGTGFQLRTPCGDALINSRLCGLFNVYNSLAAAAAAVALGFDAESIKTGLESFEGVHMRFQVKRVGGVTYLNDVYNANPSSMEVSINELVRLFQGSGGRHRRAMAVLGDMLELGEYEEEEHRKIGRRLSSLPVDILIGVGPLMKNAVEEFERLGVWTPSAEEAAAELARLVNDGDLVLIKGSRGMRMERVHELIAKGGRFNAV